MEQKLRLAKAIVKAMGANEHLCDFCVDDLVRRYGEKQLELI